MFILKKLIMKKNKIITIILSIVLTIYIIIILQFRLETPTMTIVDWLILLSVEMIVQIILHFLLNSNTNAKDSN